MFGGTYIVVQQSVLVNKKVRKEANLVDCCKFTPFGLCVKTELLRRGKTQAWLMQRIGEDTGLFVDDGYLYKILTGQRNAPKIVKAIKDILNIPDAPQA